MQVPRTYNAALDVVDRNVEDGRGGKVAFIDPAREITYGDLADGCNRVGNLLATHGVEREARVALILHDTVDFPVVFWGAIRAGIVPVAVNTLLTAQQCRYILEDSRAQALFVSAPLLSVVGPVLDGLPALEHIFVVGGDAVAPGQHTFAEALGSQSAVASPASTCADEVAFWLYSSGSTGMPKGVRHVHSSAMMTARLYGQGVLGLEEDDVVYSAAKLFFAYGLGNAMTFPMSVGATATLLPGRPTPAAVFDVLRAHQPTLFFGVPTLFASILADPACVPEAGSQRLRMCVSAGEALPEEVGRAWKARFGVDVCDGVGSTEMLHIYLSNAPGDVRYGSSGKAVRGYDLRLVDETDAEVGPQVLGELLVRGPSAADGYWNQREKSRRTFQGEWTRTGDKFTRDEGGYYTYCGRTDDMFKVSGIWVSPFEVESALVTHDAVLEAAVVPAEDEDGLVKPKAFVVVKPGAQTEGLTEALQEVVKTVTGPWKYPRWVEFVDDLPKTATGKIRRFKLRQSTGETDGA